MARVSLDIGGNRWPVACRDGEEAQVHRLGRMVSERWPQAERAAGDGGAARTLLLIALMLADELVETQELAEAQQAELAAGSTATAPMEEPVIDAAGLDRLADRLEALATALERRPASA